MTKREEFGLEFIKLIQHNETIFLCRRKNGIVDNYNLLQFISRLNIKDCSELINDIDTHLDTNSIGLNIHFFEDIDLEFNEKYIEIDKMIIISLIDLKDLLKEWISFLKSNPAKFITSQSIVNVC